MRQKTAEETCKEEELVRVVLRKGCCWINDGQVAGRPMRPVWKKWMQVTA
jgi:hypothetical protein